MDEEKQEVEKQPNQRDTLVRRMGWNFHEIFIIPSINKIDASNLVSMLLMMPLRQKYVDLLGLKLLG